jgi:glycosyltransferase involved in cell wall biosynthesis
MHSELIYELNQCDCVLLTSKWEGSPNIIKEAMALNKPIVATKVGDVPMLISNLDGCFLVEHQADEVSKAILKATEAKSTLGRQRIKELGLDANAVATRIINIYKTLNAK